MVKIPVNPDLRVRVREHLKFKKIFTLFSVKGIIIIIRWRWGEGKKGRGEICVLTSNEFNKLRKAMKPRAKTAGADGNANGSNGASIALPPPPTPTPPPPIPPPSPE